MAHASEKRESSYLAIVRPESAPSHRTRPLRVLFVHRDPEAIDACVRELKRGQFIVSHDSVLNWTQGSEHLRSQRFDLIVAEYLDRSLQKLGAMQLFRQAAGEAPLILLVAGMAIEEFALFAVQGDFEYVQREHLAHLPMTVRRVLNENKLRSDLADAEKALRHSHSLYRALVENPDYGICRCDAAGKLLDVNQVFLTMLGYASNEELLAANREADLALDLGLRMSLAAVSSDPDRAEPIEVEWKRKNGTILKARLSGRDALDEHGNFNGCEIIAVDVTEQHRLEEQLRHQASTDSLTGLANHGRFLDVLHAEVSRSKRTGREFSVVLLDLDGLKKINDQFGHLAGNRALCRVAQILKDCCRSVDTAARHGGDEFAVVLPETRAVAAAFVARRICELLDAETEQPPISVSVGIASYPADADGIGTLLQNADKALYAMKSQNLRALRAAAASLSSTTEAHPDTEAHPEFQRSRNAQHDIRRRDAAQE
jgi:diguanylate cyclase (GGDEF)-like protein/PAS domain S-box-containing protein